MEPSALPAGYDLAQITLYLFWIFFAGLIFYLQREAQREGYPVEVDTATGKFRPKSLLFYPPPKEFILPHGGSKLAPDGVADARKVPGTPTSRLPGAPIEPGNANPMRESIGPGSWAERADKPDLTHAGLNKIVPLRVATTYATSSRDPDPRGKPVIGCDGKTGGTVVDLWVDRSECILRYIEVEATGGKRVLLPITFSDISARGVKVEAITGAQFADAPTTRAPDSVTLLEEDIICAYYGAGTLYATPGRVEPLL